MYFMRLDVNHCGLVISGSVLGQVMAPSHYLSQWWLLISVVWWHPPHNNFTSCAHATILYNEFVNYTYKTKASYPWGQWVNLFPPFVFVMFYAILCSNWPCYIRTQIHWYKLYLPILFCDFSGPPFIHSSVVIQIALVPTEYDVGVFTVGVRL